MKSLKAHEILTKTFPRAHGISAAGSLAVESQEIPSSEEALKRFIEFGGEGWLQLADDREIQTFSPDKPLALQAKWPLAGEAAKENSSVCLCRERDSWKLTTITRTAPQNEDDLIMSTRFRRRDAEGFLCYETAWSPRDVFGQEEIRPAAFRFTGFSSHEKED